ncbi:hypothetical protein OG264_32130 [Streptomyces xanthophaeus]|uniref:hypothetical protein n=1 Tax=Streptomyces xanthophaeus TaxID=67385 RepID=UPI003867304B|nr:hypothetical protein OG264_32130 [Streptomyces xanthophaeus]WST59268.1 hypothetical protein OG605_06310 [Streptomyces xanthophaeus]
MRPAYEPTAEPGGGGRAVSCAPGQGPCTRTRTRPVPHGLASPTSIRRFVDPTDGQAR